MKSLTLLWKEGGRHEVCLNERAVAVAAHLGRSEADKISGIVCHIRNYAAGSIFPNVLSSMMDRLEDAFGAPGQGKPEQLIRIHTISSPRFTFDLAFNPRRKPRRKTAVQSAPSMAEPFDQFKFNFHHVDPLDLLMYFEPYNGDTASRAPDCRCESKHELARRKHAIFVNRFPLGIHSGILAPHFNRNHSQNLAEPWGREALHIGLRFAATTATSPSAPQERRSKFRVGFNSLAGGAAVNHLHFQFWEYEGAGPGGMPIEIAFKNALAKSSGFRLLARHTNSRCRLREIQGGDFPVTGFVIEGGVRSCRAATADVLHIAIRWLTTHETPYNLLFNGDDAFIIPRAATSDYSMIGGFLPAGFPEIFGEIVCHDEACMSLTADELSKHYVERLNAPLEEVTMPLRSSLLNEIGKFWELQSGMFHLNIAA